MSDLFYPIGYLEEQDFKKNGNLKENISTPCFIMIQKSTCPGCQMAKPDFQKLANEKIMNCFTIQLDGEKQSERNLSQIIDKIYPDLQYIPSYILFLSSERKIKYSGNNEFKNLKNFVQEKI